MATIRKSKTHIINNDKQDFYGLTRRHLDSLRHWSCSWHNQN